MNMQEAYKFFSAVPWQATCVHSCLQISHAGKVRQRAVFYELQIRT